MILTFDSSKEISGRFFEYEFICTIHRNEQTENFNCFKNNTNQSFNVKRKVYCYDDKCFNHLLDEWNRLSVFMLKTYSYYGVGKSIKSFTAEQVRQIIFDDDKNKLPVLLTFGSFDYIL